MTVRIARERIEEALIAAEKKLGEAGLSTRGRTFYADKNLSESSDFSPSAILVFGTVTVAAQNLDSVGEDDTCDYSLCCEIKTALVDEDELKSAIEEFNAEIDSLLKMLDGATSKEALIEEISRRQSNEAAEAAVSFEKEMKKIKRRLYFAVGGVIVIILGIIIAGTVLL